MCGVRVVAAGRLARRAEYSWASELVFLGALCVGARELRFRSGGLGSRATDQMGDKGERVDRWVRAGVGGSACVARAA